MSWLSIDLRFKWLGCQMIWGSSDLVVNWCVIQMILSNEAFARDFLRNWSFETQKRSFSARLPSKTKLWSSKTKRLCETSFKIAAFKLQNEAFVRDFLQKWIYEDQKQSNSAKLRSKTKLWNSKTKLFCETSFKIEALKIKNKAFLRDFLQNWHVEQTLDLRIPIRFNDFRADASKVLRLPRKSWAEAYEVLQLPREMITAQHFRDLKFATLPRILRRRLQTSTSQSAKSLRLPRETHRFGASSNPPRLPTFLQPSRTPAPATYFATCRNPCACHAKHTFNLQKRPKTVSF